MLGPRCALFCPLLSGLLSFHPYLWEALGSPVRKGRGNREHWGDDHLEPLEGPSTIRSKAGDTQVRGSEKVPRALGHRIQGWLWGGVAPSGVSRLPHSPEWAWEPGNPVRGSTEQGGEGAPVRNPGKGSWKDRV